MSAARSPLPSGASSSVSVAECLSAISRAMGKALGGGSGRVLLTCSARGGKLVNQWASDHAHCLAGATPVLALDMYEHSYHMDYGAKAAAYVDAFMQNVNWGHAPAHFAQAARQGRA